MVKGHVTYYLSPMHQKVFSGVMSKTLKNFTVKVSRSWVYPLPSFLAWLWIHHYADTKSHEISRSHRP